MGGEASGCRDCLHGWVPRVCYATLWCATRVCYTTLWCATTMRCAARWVSYTTLRGTSAWNRTWCCTVAAHPLASCHATLLTANHEFAATWNFNSLSCVLDLPLS